MPKQLTACFFCKTADRSVLDRADFYAQDLRILRDLGFEVHIATGPAELVVADIYFVWWWTWAFVPVTFARTIGRPVVVTGTFDLWMFDDRPRLHRALHRYALRGANANVFISEMERAAVANQFPTRNPVYVPLGVDTKRLTPGTSEREAFVLTIAGSGMDRGNSARKCIAEVIRAAPLVRARHPEIRFVIVGKHGSDYPMLSALARELGAADYVDFPGIVTEADKISLLQRCRVYLQPSRHEGFGLSVLEAMSCGAPVVTNAAGALPEVGADAVRYAADPTPEAIAATTIALLDDESEQRQLSARARARAEQWFTRDRRRDGLATLIHSLVKTDRTRV